MLLEVRIGRRCCGMYADFENHRLFVGDELVDEVRALACDLKRASKFATSIPPLGVLLVQSRDLILGKIPSGDAELSLS